MSQNATKVWDSRKGFYSRGQPVLRRLVQKPSRLIEVEQWWTNVFACRWRQWILVTIAWRHV